MTAKLMSVMAVAAVLAGCRADDPTSVAKRFWRAYQLGDQKDLEALVTEASRDALRFVGTDEDIKDAEIVFGLPLTTMEEDRATVPTTVKRKAGGDLVMETVLLRENGKWRVALHETHASAVGGAFKGLGQAFMQAMGETARYIGRGAEEAGSRLQESGREMMGTTPPAEQQPATAPPEQK